MKDVPTLAAWTSESPYYEHHWANPSSEDSLAGRGKGIFIVDDEIPVFSEDEPDGWVVTLGDSVVPTQAGLLPIFRVAKTWPTTVFIHFLRLTGRSDVDSLVSRIVSLSAHYEIRLDCIYLLTDVFVGDSSEGDGVGLFLRSRLEAATNQSPSPVIRNMKIGILSVLAPGRDGFQKAEVQEWYDDYKDFSLPTALPPKLLDWLDVSLDPDDVADLDVRRWRDMRTVALMQNSILYKKPHWQHHWKGGGADRRPHEPRKKDRDKLSRAIAHAIGRVPPINVDYWPGYADARPGSFRRAPLRAITQMDSGADVRTNAPGRDLKQCITLAAAETNSLCEHATELRPITPLRFSLAVEPPTFKHDYLWFNAPCLFAGLVGLAEQFVHELDKFGSANQHAHFSTFVLTGARIDWQVSERTAKEIGVGVTVTQIITGRYGNSEVVDEIFPLPTVPIGRAMEGCYAYLERAGAHIANDAGTLRLEVFSEVMTDDIWLVKDGHEGTNS